MNLKKIFYLFLLCNLSFSCAEYQVQSSKKNIEKTFYSSKGFALVFSEDLYQQRVINKKLNNLKVATMHNILRVNTPVKILNPSNSKFIETKIAKKGDYPKIFNIVLSESAASILELDPENPYVEVYEIKKNKKFVAKKSNTFDEEKNVADKAPVDEIKMDDITEVKVEKKKKVDKTSYILVISDFYYETSANNLMAELVQKININMISVKKININKYRLLVGPFENFNALKTTYISLNNLGFEDLNIYRE